MNVFKCGISGLLLAGALCVVAGCDEGQDVGMVGGQVYPPVGSLVHVQFRRDHLGFAGDKGSSPVDSDASRVLASSGELRRITEEFVVLGFADEPNRELWIPREVILLMEVRRPDQPQPK